MKNKKKKILVSFALSLFFAIGFFGIGSMRQDLKSCPVAVQAASDFQGKMDTTANQVEERGLVPCTLSQCTFCDLLKMIERIFFWLLSVAFVLAILFLVISGFAYILSVGDSGAMSWAKEGLKFSIIGFVICITSWLAIHALYVVLGYGDNWWQIQCADQANTVSVNESKNPAAQYANEVAADLVGGRDEPISLPDLAQQGVANIPDNQYFFIHGLGGQPIDSAAKQILQLAQTTKSQGKIVFAITPKTDLNTGDIESYVPVNLNNYLGSDEQQNLDNIKNFVVQLMADAPTSEFPLIISKSAKDLAKFTEWPHDLDPKKALATLSSDGVLYLENNSKVVDKGAADTSLFTINLAQDEKTNKFTLNRDNPITFQFPSNVSFDSARAAAVNIAKVVAGAAKNSNSMGKDQWNQLINLIAKNPDLMQISGGDQNDSATNSNYGSSGSGSGSVPAYNTGSSGFNGDSYNTGVFPAGVSTSPNQHVDPDTLDKNVRQVELIAKNTIDQELGSYNFNTNRNTQNPVQQRINTDRIESDISSVISGFNDEVSPETNAPKDMLAKNSNNKYNNNPIAAPKAPEVFGTVPASNPNNSFNNALQNKDYNQIAQQLNPYVSNVSPIQGQVSTSWVLNLDERTQIRKMLQSIEKEMTDNDNGNNINLGVDIMMCIFDHESTWRPAVAGVGGIGLGQLTGRGSDSSNSISAATNHLKKFAPKAFEGLSEQVKKATGQDMEKVLRGNNKNNEKVKLLTSNPNVNAALSYALLDSKKRGQNGGGKPIGSNAELRRIVNNYGPGESDYAGRSIVSAKKKNGGAISIMECKDNLGWRGFTNEPATANATTKKK